MQPEHWQGIKRSAPAPPLGLRPVSSTLGRPSRRQLTDPKNPDVFRDPEA
jgi:hypothetical protein